MSPTSRDLSFGNVLSGDPIEQGDPKPEPQICLPSRSARVFSQKGSRAWTRAGGGHVVSAEGFGKLEPSPGHGTLGMKCVALGSESAQSSQQAAKGVRGDCLDSKSQIHDRPSPKGTADPIPPPHSCSPNLFPPHHFQLDIGKVVKIFRVHVCKGIPGFSLSLS